MTRTDEPGQFRIIEACMSKGVVVIDAGLSAGPSRDTCLIGGFVRVTTLLPEDCNHAERCIGFDEDDELTEARNQQAVELNALNAALAVVRWKKLNEVYDDLGGELDCLYDLADNSIDNTEKRITAIRPGSRG